MKKFQKAVLITLLFAGGIAMVGLGIFIAKSKVAGRSRGLGAGLVLAISCGVGIKKVWES